MEIKLNQGSEEWKKFRKEHISGTDAPVIMEVSPWDTPYQLWLNKIGHKPDKPVNEAMKRGLSLEGEARNKFEELIGMEFTPKVIISDEIEWMMTSLDGMSFDGKEIVEIKCPNREDHQIAKEGLIPSKYYPQIQHQIAVCGLDRAYYFSYDGNLGACVEVKRDDPYIKKMIEREKDFYSCIVDVVSPDLTERDFTIREDDEWQEYCFSMREASELKKQYEEQEDFYKKKLIELSSGRNTKGCGVSVSKHLRRGQIDYKNIPGIDSLRPENHRKPSVEVWRVST